MILGMLRNEKESLLRAQKDSSLHELKFLRPNQVPRVYPLSRATVYKLLGQGVIKSIQVGHARLISVASIEGYLARLAKEQAGESFTPCIVKDTGQALKRREACCANEEAKVPVKDIP